MRIRLVETLALASVATILGIVACSSETSSTTRNDSIEASPHTLPPVSPPIAQVDNAYSLASKVALPATKPVDSHGLHNLFKLSPEVLSGAEPHGEEAFQQLAAMGVKTIVSVDGKKPEIELAKKYGMRYVHIPIEYKGISDEELEQLVKTYREINGPFFVHCFHGKHRGPAAAAIGRIVLDGISREEAIAEMRQWCGTAPEYEGLYRDVATKLIPTEAETRAYVFGFPETRSFGGFREAMISISRLDDSLKKLSQRDFAVDPAHPDVDPVQAAATLADTLRISGTLSEIYDRPQDFHEGLAKSAALALKLEEQLTAVSRGEPGAIDVAKKGYSDLAKSCTACHAVYRNH